MNGLAKALGLLTATLLILSIPVLIFFATRGLWRELTSLNPNMGIALITAASTIIVSTVTVMIGRYYERKKEIEAHFRAVKLQMYEEFMEEFFKMFHSDDSESVDLVPFLREWQRKIALKAGPNVLAKYFNWKTELRKD